MIEATDIKQDVEVDFPTIIQAGSGSPALLEVHTRPVIGLVYRHAESLSCISLASNPRPFTDACEKAGALLAAMRD